MHDVDCKSFFSASNLKVILIELLPYHTNHLCDFINFDAADVVTRFPHPVGWTRVKADDINVLKL